MANIRGLVAGSAVTRKTGDGDYIDFRASRAGELFVQDWRQALVYEGRAFHVTVGALTTPIVGGGNGTTPDLDQPEFALSIPDGTAIVPMRVHVQVEVPLLAADSEVAEIILGADRVTAIGGGTSTAETAFNMRTDNPRTTLCTAASAYTANSTAEPVLGIELARSQRLGDFQGTPANAMWTQLELLYEPLNSPIIMGPATLLVYWGGTVAASGFAQVVWAELPENAFV